MARKKRRIKNPELPHEIEILILSKLPVKTLLRFKAVCKPWRDVIESSQFENLHLPNIRNHVEKVLLVDYSYRSAVFYVDGRRSEISAAPGEKFHLYPSNGVLLMVGDLKTMRLWNPSTGKSKDIPDPPCSDLPACFYGFRHDPVSGGFMVLIVRSGRNVVNVFNSDSATWKTIDIPINLNAAFIPSQLHSKAFIHGGFHFIDSGRIWSLSPEGKIVNNFPKPPQIPRDFVTVVFGGRLCLKGINYFDRVMEVWEMEKYGDDNSWKRLFQVPFEIPRSPIPLSPLLRNGVEVPRNVVEVRRVFPWRDFRNVESVTPVYLLENGRRVLVRNNKRDLYVQDLDKKAMTKVPSLPDFPNWFTIAIDTYTESLLSP